MPTGYAVGNYHLLAGSGPPKPHYAGYKEFETLKKSLVVSVFTISLASDFVLSSLVWLIY